MICIATEKGKQMSQLKGRFILLEPNKNQMAPSYFPNGLNKQTPNKNSTKFQINDLLEFYSSLKFFIFIFEIKENFSISAVNERNMNCFENANTLPIYTKTAAIVCDLVYFNKEFMKMN